MEREWGPRIYIFNQCVSASGTYLLWIRYEYYSLSGYMLRTLFPRWVQLGNLDL